MGTGNNPAMHRYEMFADELFKKLKPRPRSMILALRCLLIFAIAHRSLDQRPQHGIRAISSYVKHSRLLQIALRRQCLDGARNARGMRRFARCLPGLLGHGGPTPSGRHSFVGNHVSNGLGWLLRDPPLFLHRSDFE